jgi:putative colanic acid biosynthesis UDP-glucose lipid carrier transferase
MPEAQASTVSSPGGELPLQPQGQSEWVTSLVDDGSVSAKAVRLGSHDPPAVTLFKSSALPLSVVLMLVVCVLIRGQTLSLRFWALALVTFLISARVFSPLDLRDRERNNLRTGKAVARILLEWSCVYAILLLLKIAFNADALPRVVLLGWYLATPIALLIVDSLSIPIAKHLAVKRSEAERYIIIGANDVGLELARRIAQSHGGGRFFGFLDYRGVPRLPDLRAPDLRAPDLRAPDLRAPDPRAPNLRSPNMAEKPITGNCSAQDFADFVRRNFITRVYLALPLSTAPRIEQLLRELRDTTASVYFVPNLFAFDLVQARCVEINGMPAFSICDSPLHGMSGFWKRAFDLLLAALLLLLCWPVLLVVAAVIKVSSPGPVLFKQRRYGLNGEEILIYKFRSMTVCEDGPVVAQAKRDDRRVTRIGAFLRRTSMDELPQILNVLEGKMSFVGPRPHAVAHNEEYRKLINGYMIRHKVRPGITGWAQVNGLRGETSTVDKMHRRVQYDIDYLKNWSLAWDLRILARTLVTVLTHSNAY